MHTKHCLYTSVDVSYDIVVDIMTFLLQMLCEKV